MLLSLLANSVKLNLFTLVELLRFSFTLPFPAALEEEEMSFLMGMALVEMEREGRASEWGRGWGSVVVLLVAIRAWRSEVVGGEVCPWKADMACGFRNGIDGLLGAGLNGLELGSGVLLPDI